MANPNPIPRGEHTRIPPVRDVEIKSFAFRVYSISWLRYMLNRKTKTLRAWEDAGVLPRPIIKLDDGYRWYSAAEILGYTKIVQVCCRIVSQGTFRPLVPMKDNGLKKSLQSFHANLLARVRDDPTLFLPKLPMEGKLKAKLREQRMTVELDQDFIAACIK